jgi:hypothetical protein
MIRFRDVAGYSMNDHIRNTEIREELNIFNLINKIVKYRSPWKCKVLRMENRQIPSKYLRRNTECPQLR